MRPSKSTKKESAATVVDMDAENTSESEVDATLRSYAAVVARPGTTPATEGRQPPPGPPPPGRGDLARAARRGRGRQPSNPGCKTATPRR